MTTPISERLRDAGNGLFHPHPLGDYGICDEAADTIDELVEALEYISVNCELTSREAAKVLAALSRAKGEAK